MATPHVIPVQPSDNSWSGEESSDRRYNNYDMPSRSTHPHPTLQIPSTDAATSAGPPVAGSSRGASRPVSATTQSPSQATGPTPSRKRASHQVTTANNFPPTVPVYRDVYSHPAAIAYAEAHPRRQIPKFGPYLLLQTLGEGEFGKVKLGLHGEWGEEVAVKLIRRGNVDNAVRLSKVEREIEVLKKINHPNIVRLYDVIETDKYIGIILEFAQGGELFDFILAHRYLKEKDACKLFAQLISGVSYIHSKKIVHRDLKLENLLLDARRNVIITDFGFANRFEHKADDLMQTSCGSPCYAAPELVISEGLYVGSAVDIWSCGVILYAMLAGYLPFDDDPQNPDGDNINLLYKYILNTQLTFPDYVSPAARDLLSKMLVPDPSRRSDLKAIMAHEWLRPYSYLFDKSVDELERLATEQQRQKRLAYQNSMRAAAAQEQAKMSRSQSARTDMPLVGSGTPATSRSRSTRDHPPVAGQHRPQDFYDNSGILESPAHPVPSGRRAVVSATIPLSTSPVEQNPFSRDFPTTLGPKDEYASPMDPRTRKGSKSSATKKSSKPPTQQSVEDPSKKKNHGGFRHTIQLEYDDGESPTSPAPASAAPRKRTTSQSTAHLMSSSPLPSPPSEPAVSPVHAVGAGAVPNGKAQSPYFHPASDAVDDRSGTPRKRTDNTTELSATPHSGRHAQSPSRSDESARSGTKESERSSPITNGYGTPRASATKSAPAPTRDTPTPTATQNGSPQQSQPDTQASSVTSTSSQSTTGSQSKHRHGLSMDKLGLGKLLGNDNSQPQPSNNTSNNRSKPPVSGTGSGSRKRSDSKLSNGTADDGSVKSTEKKSRRTTLSLMVEPFGRSIKERARGSSRNSQTTPTSNTILSRPGTSDKPSIVTPNTGSSLEKSRSPPTLSGPPEYNLGPGTGSTGSTSKAKKVMDWFRNKSLAKSADAPVPPSIPVFDRPLPPFPPAEDPTTPTMQTYKDVSSTSTVNVPPKVVVTTPGPQDQGSWSAQMSPTPSASHSAETSHSAPVKLRAPASAPAPQIIAHGGQRGIFIPNGAVARPQFNKALIKVHRGAVDQGTITIGSPPEVFASVTKVLKDMGIQIHSETDFKYRCVRPKRGKTNLGTTRDSSLPGNALTAYTMVGSAGSGGQVDKRGLPVPSSFGSTGGVLKGFLLRRGSSQHGAANNTAPQETDGIIRPALVPSNSSLGNSLVNSQDGLSVTPSTQGETIFGDVAADAGDEVKFSVELTRIDRLDDTYSLDIRRLKGNLRSYKFLYDSLRERCDFLR